MNRKQQQNENQVEAVPEAGGNGRPPIESVRYGAVGLSVWEEVNEKGTFFRPGRLTRSFVDETGKWSTTFYLRESDLLDAALACQDIYRRLSQLRRERRATERQGDGSQEAANI